MALFILSLITDTELERLSITDMSMNGSPRVHITCYETVVVAHTAVELLLGNEEVVGFGSRHALGLFYSLSYSLYIVSGTLLILTILL